MPRPDFEELSRSPEWASPPAEVGLQPGQADLWRVDLGLPEETFSALKDTLSAGELEQAARFYFEQDRYRYIAAHGCLRAIISCYLSLQPRRLEFTTGPYGKPELAGSAAEDIEFNLSHSGRFALVGVTRGRRIGVDVELRRTDIAVEELARHYFSPAEVAELSSLPVERRHRAFYHGWARKEAYIKAQGFGLHLALDSFDVSLAQIGSHLLLATRPDGHEASKWTLRHLDIHPEYAAAAAVEGREVEFRLWDWRR